MNVREIPGLWSIRGFHGEYAEFYAKDKQGLYRGLINRKGEIVWNDGLRYHILRVRNHPTVFMSIKRGEENYCYFDVVKQQYVEEPVVEPRKLSKVEAMVEKTPFIDTIDPFDHHLCSYRPLQVLTDNYLAFAEDLYKWGVRDLEGNVLIPAQYAHVYYGGHDTHFLVDLEEEYGVIDLNGNWVIPFGKFDWLWCRGDYFLARKNGKTGIVDLEGNIIIPFEYTELAPAHDEGLDLISAKIDGEFFFINAKQEKINLF